MRRLLLATILMLTQFNVGAGSISSCCGVSMTIQQHASGYVFINFYGPVTRLDAPGCATIPNRMVLLVDNDTRRELLATIRASLGVKPITFYGTGTCAVRPDTETLDFVIVG